jgi:hypothetical protein
MRRLLHIASLAVLYVEEFYPHFPEQVIVTIQLSRPHRRWRLPFFQLLHRLPHDSASVLLPSSLRATGGAAMAVAAAGVLRIRHVARSLFSESQTMRTSISASDLPLGSNLSLDFLPSRRSGGMKLTNGGKRSSIQRLAIPESYYNPNSPSGKARQIERYLNFLLVHPAMSSSFPLSIILKVS